MSETKRTQQEQLDRFKQLFGTRKDSIELMNAFDDANSRSQETQTRRERAECIGKNMFDFNVGDEVAVNMNRDFHPDYFRGTVVRTAGERLYILPDMDEPYAYECVDRRVMRPVVTA